MTLRQAPIAHAPRGRLDFAAGAALVRELARDIEAGAKDHILDLRSVEAVDSEALRSIIRMRRRLREVGGRLRLLIDDARAVAFVRSTGLDRLFAIYETPDAALAGFAEEERVPA